MPGQSYLDFGPQSLFLTGWAPSHWGLGVSDGQLITLGLPISLWSESLLLGGHPLIGELV
jgi:hypothetical protein